MNATQAPTQIDKLQDTKNTNPDSYKHSLPYNIDNQEWSLAKIFSNSYNTSPLSPESIAAYSRWGKTN